IQITNAPSVEDGMDHDGFVDLVMGYSPSRRVLVAYDRRWLERRMEKGSGSPSVQVSEHDIQAGFSQGLHHCPKKVSFGMADILTLRPEFLPDYLADHEALLSGVSAAAGASNIGASGNVSLWQFCMDRG